MARGQVRQGESQTEQRVMSPFLTNVKSISNKGELYYLRGLLSNPPPYRELICGFLPRFNRGIWGFWQNLCGRICVTQILPSIW